MENLCQNANRQARVDHMMRKFFPARRFQKAALATTVFLTATFALGSAVWACSDDTCHPSWRLGTVTFDCASQGMLTPGNDTRINMIWLMMSLRGAMPREAQPVSGNDPQFGRTFLTWSSLSGALAPASAVGMSDTSSAASTCEPTADAVPAFEAALAAENGLPAADRVTLSQLRAKVGCSDVSLDSVAVASRSGREYLAYLKAAQAFHANDWMGAKQGFATLTRAKSRWIAETAAYMPIRIGLRSAMVGAVTEYGDFAGIEKVDATAVAQARDAIVAYLKAYPQGRYANSAMGLKRRVAWMTGDTANLARAYEKLLATTPADDINAGFLVQEIDNKLLEDQPATAGLEKLKDTPLLLAIADLKRLRRDTETDSNLTQEQLYAQKEQFAAHPELFGLLESTRAFYANENPRAIMALLPDEARSKSFTPLAFSRQMLRGMALAKAKDANEPRFWRELLNGASPFYQRPLVEMGLAVRWQREGRPDRIFAAGSPITDVVTREILLQTIATPSILRANANDSSRPAHERDVARFALLYKDLAHGAYSDFGPDLALVPVNAPAKASLWDFSIQEEIPVGIFRAGPSSDEGFTCPALVQTVGTLARSATDRRAQLCLGEFYRLNGFDGFGLFRADPKQDQLGTGPDGFPGAALSRSDLYASVIADRKALPEARAYALYRAVMCYAPSGYNGCVSANRTRAELDAAEVSVSQRKAWFTELKQRYPNSQWATALRYYW